MKLKFISELHDKSRAFVLIGLLCGLLIVIDPYLAKDGMVYAYLKYAQIPIDLSEHADAIISEHMAFMSISYMVVILMILSSIHRAFFGCDESSSIYLKFIRPIEDFLLSLNGALLGLFIGVAAVAIIEAVFFNGSFQHALGFIFFCFIPHAFSFTVHLSRQVVSERFVIGKYVLGQVGDMLEGLFLLILAILLLTYHVQFIDFYQSIPGAIVNFLSRLWDALGGLFKL